jgi:alkylhydroperoxidase family enzyme
MSARSAVALQQGVDEAMLDAVDDHRDSGLAPEHRAALALADAYLGSPASMTDDVRQQVAEHLSPQQAIEIVLKLMGFSNDKVMVAMGHDLDEVRIFTLE